MPIRTLDEEAELSPSDSEDGDMLGGAEYDPPAPPAPTVSVDEASRVFSDKLFTLSDLVSEGKIPEQVYLDLSMAAKNLHEAKRTAPPPSNSTVGALDHVRGRISEIIQDYDEEISGYRDQLTGATLELDRLRSTKEHHTKCIAALKGVVISAKIPDSRLLEAYQRKGCLERVLVERERKRKRDNGGPSAGPVVEAPPPHAVINVVDSDDDE